MTLGSPSSLKANMIDGCPHGYEKLPLSNAESALSDKARRDLHSYLGKRPRWKAGAFSTARNVEIRGF